jgi:hypothetical protein
MQIANTLHDKDPPFIEKGTEPPANLEVFNVLLAVGVLLVF